ncbi:hypothetical protein HPB48_010517 [Haemaphysalis longicornis]|uniref:Calcineurin-like phosphoesterase domain-containing protein n=1 Tax=Haemaphysalis longicornis TaxID=44386 RepID=A0A9J6FQF8_HAELO|nr:hypothetical protein HPB48_010517 [Haemaphysalis longicornis]
MPSTVQKSFQPYHITEDSGSAPDFRVRARNRTYEGLTKETEGTWQGPFFFIQAADTQFGMTESYLEKKPDPRWDKEIALTEKAVEAVNRMDPKPRFFIVCGDLVDAMPGDHRKKPQEDDWKRVFSKMSSDVSLVCVCGNHDIGNQPTPASVRGYQDSFGDDYFVFWCGGVMCLVLNSQFYEDPSLSTGSSTATTQLAGGRDGPLDGRGTRRNHRLLNEIGRSSELATQVEKRLDRRSAYFSSETEAVSAAC